MPFKALIFDSVYDTHRGAIIYVAVADGEIKKGDKVTSSFTKKSYEVQGQYLNSFLLSYLLNQINLNQKSEFVDQDLYHQINCKIINLDYNHKIKY